MELSKYFEIGKGTVPIVLSCPHGGYKKPKNIPDKAKGPNIADKNTYLLAKMVIKALEEKNVKIFYIFNKIHRSKIDVNRPPLSIAAFEQSSNEARSIHHLYHDTLINFALECVELYGRALVYDLHGFSKPHGDYPDIIFGHIFGKTLDLIENPNETNCDKYWGCAQLQLELSKLFSLDDGLGSNNYNIAYSGGYITHQFYNQANISAIQLEIAKYIRLDSSLMKQFANSFVKAILTSISNFI